MATTAPAKQAGRARAKLGKRKLHLANPYITGPDVRAAQELLAKNVFEDFFPGDIDGEYGPATAGATRRAKWALGYPKDSVDGAFGELLAGYLSGTPLPPEFAARRKRRAAEAKKSSNVRERIVEFAHWGVKNTARIHYRQSRPIDGRGRPKKLPLYTDCSGFVTLCYEWAGAEDPNGVNFSGYGYTGTLLRHCRRISKDAARPGDLVIWTPPADGQHVSIVVEGGPDLLLASHGSDRGPILIRFSDQHAYQSRNGHNQVAWMSNLP